MSDTRKDNISNMKLQESLNRLLKSHACDFLIWADTRLYTQDDNGLWYSFPTQDATKRLTTSELYDIYFEEQKSKQ